MICAGFLNAPPFPHNRPLSILSWTRASADGRPFVRKSSGPSVSVMPHRDADAVPCCSSSHEAHPTPCPRQIDRRVARSARQILGQRHRLHRAIDFLQPLGARKPSTACRILSTMKVPSSVVMKSAGGTGRIGFQKCERTFRRIAHGNHRPAHIIRAPDLGRRGNDLSLVMQRRKR